jgi:protein SCO1/2
MFKRRPDTARARRAGRSVGFVRTTAVAAVAVACTLLVPAPLSSEARGQVLLDSIPQTENAGLVRKEGAELDRSLEFTDWAGRRVTLGEAIDGEMPIVLCLAYFDCPLICPQTMANLSRAVSGIDGWRAGEDYRVLVISFDHNDTPAAAKVQRDRFLGPGFSHEPAENGVLFWTSTPEQVKPLADSVGFYYEYYPKVDDFSHASALILINPDGKVHNYYPGITYESPTLRRLLLEAGSSGERSLIEQAALLCFTWRPDENKWVVNPMRVMQLVGGATVTLTAAFLLVMFLTDRVRKARKAAAASRGHPAPST